MTLALLIFYAILHRRPVFEDFLIGARKGVTTTIELFPTITGLLVAVRVLRASGLLDALAHGLRPLTERIHFPAELLPLALTRLFSTSAANGLLLDLYQTLGPDSPEGYLGSLIMSSTEAAFYTISIYFTASKITKTRWTLPGALAATLAGIAASIALTYL